MQQKFKVDQKTVHQSIRRHRTSPKCNIPQKIHAGVTQEL